jgi:hypothetical protein
MAATSYTTGLIFFSLLTSAVLTVPTGEWLLWLYRRAVHRGMTSGPQDQSGSPDDDTPSRTAIARQAIRILDHGDALTSGTDEGNRFHDAEQSLRRAAAVYALGGFAYGLMFAIGWNLSASDGLLVWSRIVWMTVVYWWPAVLAIQLVAATSRGERLVIADA